ncbi:BQ2448_8083 [Microbotryum intermedium]|uniref:BQ2448_8083 protein n=1 Tax=Microbotryum intermedium TaxID=269621 RepID=A0A238FRE6_9BASI|nr:BQ2448_8083 [Microbotryum intermedium]
MAPIRMFSLGRLFLAVFSLIFFLHLFSPPALTDRALDDEREAGWSERLGLDHYADWEAGVTNKLGNGLDVVKQGIKGGLGWGSQRTRLGSLYELVASSDSSPRPSYFDGRTSIDRLRLTSARYLGHGPNDDVATPKTPESAAAEAEDNIASMTRRHILVTGGFGSLGRYTVRDLLLGHSSGAFRSKTSKDPDEWVAVADQASPINPSREDLLVTIVDVKDRSAELDFLLHNAPIDEKPKIKGTDPRASAFASSERSIDSFKKQGKLRIVIGDVRDKDLMKKMFSPDGMIVTELATQQSPAVGEVKPIVAGAHLTTTVRIPPVSGVIHLAAYDPSACRLNSRDCENVESEGMDVMLEQLERPGLEKPPSLGSKAVYANRPWIVVPRRRDSWNDVPEAYNRNASELSTEGAIEALKTFTVHHPLHSLLLRLPPLDSIVGNPYASRFEPIPHLVESALGHMPLHVYTSPEKNEPFLAANDASMSIIQSARMLELASRKKFLRALGFVAEVDVIGAERRTKGPRVLPIVDMVKTIIQLTSSQSPFLEIQQLNATSSPGGLNAEQLKLQQAMFRKRADKIIGFTSSTALRVELKRYIAAILKRHMTHLSSKINVACASPPSTSVLESGILAMNGCSAQLLTIVEGSFWTLGCSEGIEEPHLEPLALLPAVPFIEGVRAVEIVAEQGHGGKADLQLRCPIWKDGKVTGKSEVVIWAETPDGGEFALASKPGIHKIAEWFSVDFVKRDSRSFSLSLPPTQGKVEGEEKKLFLTVPEPTSVLKKIMFKTDSDSIRLAHFKINPICCPSKDVRKEAWDFFKEDPLLASHVTFPTVEGRTSLIDSTTTVQRCRELHAESERIRKLEHSLDPKTAEPVCNPKRGDAPGWSARSYPICPVDCDAPLKCIATERCKCTRDRCGDSGRGGPFPGVAGSDRISFSKTVIPVPKLTLQQRVDAIPWEHVILPGARQAFATPLNDLPFAHVVDLPKSIDNHLTSPACWNIDKSPLPFLGDHILIEALKERSVPLADADFVMVPYYQGCYYNYLQENTFKKLADTIAYAEARTASVPHINAAKIVVPFTHDFGSCTGWWPKLGNVLRRKPPVPMDQALAWQVNGDYNTKCVKPDRDVIIPAVTKHTKALLETHKTAKDIVPVQDRKYLAFFAGGVRGFGAIVRTKLGCGRSGDQRGSGKILYQQYAPNRRYLGTLSAARFCLLPRGIPAWSTRTFEAIYAGCIPAFIVDRNLFPFQDILDYSLFSVSIPESEAHRVEEILETYSEQQLIEMQAALVKVRDAFVFKERHEWERKGPLFFSLVSIMMRLDLGYPQVGSCGTVVKDTTQ